MKVLFYINILSGGGAERVVANLANVFSKNGHKVILVNSFQTDKEYNVSSSIIRYYLETDIKSNSNFIIRNILRIRKLRRIIKKEKPDFAISFMLEPNVRLVVSSLGLSVKTIISVRNDPAREYEGFIGRIIARFILPLSNGCVFQTKDAMRWFSKKIQNKSSIIYNPVNEIFYRTKYDGIRKNIVTTGRLDKQKNHELLIRAYASISNIVEDKLIIYGEGSERKNLEKLIEKLNMTEKIFLPGNVSNVAETIKSAKLYVLSSDYEGMPNGLMEAMALGLPCVTTDCPCGGARALIKHKENGVIVKVNDEKQLALTMLLILKDEKRLNELGKNARISALNFQSKAIFKKWKQFLMGII